MLLVVQSAIMAIRNTRIQFNTNRYDSDISTVRTKESSSSTYCNIDIQKHTSWYVTLQKISRILVSHFRAGHSSRPQTGTCFSSHSLSQKLRTQTLK